jgi:hypothetical protein
LYLVLNVRPVCPIYFNGQFMHLIWYTPLFSYSSRRRGFTKFCMVFFVRNAVLTHCGPVASYDVFRTRYVATHYTLLWCHADT